MHRFSRFLREDSGAVAPIVAIALVALVSMGGLAYDVSRGFALRTELDNAVDAAALAGATQLDGSTGAMSRALAAAQGAFVRNGQRLADVGETNVAIAGGNVSFLKDLTTRAVATTDADAHFIQIDLSPRNLSVVFGAMVRPAGFTVRAHAVAGYGAGICKVPPLLICNPAEASGVTTFDGDSYTGKGFMLTPPPGGNTAWGPGNFGFLDVGSGAADVKNAMGRFPPETHCFGTEVITKPGNVTSADDWFNTRFDIYNASAGGNKTDPAFAPAMNTMIGVASNAGNSACSVTPVAPSNDCSSTAAVSAMGLPLDCGQTSQLGSGQWNVRKYFNTNHSGGPDPTTYTPDTPAGATGTGWNAYGPAPAAGATSPTRFQVYEWELAMLRGPANGGITPPSWAFSNGQGGSSGSKDFAGPQCNTSGAQTSPDRRTISAVVANCIADGVRGASTVHVIAYVDLFLIAPAVNNSIYGEVISATSDISTVGRETMLYSVRLYE